jgi:hypothetical protein
MHPGLAVFCYIKEWQGWNITKDGQPLFRSVDGVARPHFRVCIGLLPKCLQLNHDLSKLMFFG